MAGILVVAGMAAVDAKPTCRRLNDVELQKRFEEYSKSISPADSSRFVMVAPPEVSSSTKRKRSTTEEEPAVCRGDFFSLPSGQDDPVSRRSICPWEIEALPTDLYRSVLFVLFFNNTKQNRTRTHVPDFIRLLTVTQFFFSIS